MSKRLKIDLLVGWGDHSSENPDGPPTFYRDDVETPGVLQVSFAEYHIGEIPNPSEADLIDLSRGIGEKEEGSQLITTSSGQCRLGQWGTAVFRTSVFPRFQVWNLSNGRDIVFVTYICEGEPSREEITQVQDIVNRINLVDQPWWRFW